MSNTGCRPKNKNFKLRYPYKTSQRNKGLKNSENIILNVKKKSIFFIKKPSLKNSIAYSKLI